MREPRGAVPRFPELEGTSSLHATSASFSAHSLRRT